MKLKIFSFLIIFSMMFAILAGCSSPKKETGESVTTTNGTEQVEVDPFEGFNYEGRDFRIYTSTNDASGVGNSNYLIQGPEEETGDVVNDSAFERNRAVEEKLNIKFKFEGVNLVYNEVANNITKLVTSADDVYDLIINDLFPIAALSLEGYFTNVLTGQHFDFTQSYWSYDYMADLTIGNEVMFILAGDYFIDVLRSAHALYFNKNLMENIYHETDEIYNTVNDNKWTIDRLSEYIKGAYSDLNGNNEKDADDQLGYIAIQIWGPSIPFILSGNVGFITRDSDGIPEITVNNERSLKLAEKVLNIFYNEGSMTTISSDLLKFESGTALFIGNQRIGSFEDLRAMEHDVGIVPYPKLDEEQPFYVTSSHDTTEIGVIPITTSDMEYISAVLEVLGRETKNIVLPAYYETALKIKYTRDDYSAQMIDIIHGNIRDTFPLAYDDKLSTILMKNTFYYGCFEKNKINFASAYAQNEKSANNALQKIIDTFLKNNVK